MLKAKKIKTFIAAVTLGVFIVALASPTFANNNDGQGEDYYCKIIPIIPDDDPIVCIIC